MVGPRAPTQPILTHCFKVLHGVQNDNSVHNVYTLFVTDYTRNPFASPTQGQWCPPKLAEVVMPIELWESSTALGPTMQAGEFYSIRNIKLRVSGGGYAEGKMVEAEKITKLNEDDLENQPRLAALLKYVNGLPAIDHARLTTHGLQTEERVGNDGEDDWRYPRVPSPTD